MERTQCFIDGGWRTATGGRAITVVNPATTDKIATVRSAGAQDVDRAVGAARRAFDEWSRTDGATRAEALHRIADCLEARAKELAETITREVGMPAKLARAIQVDGPIAAWRRYAELTEEYAFEDRIAHSRVVRVPAGVVACITPWNYPLHQITAKIGAAIAAGCTVVLKPSELTPLCAFILAEAIEAAELPAGVFNMVVGTGAEVGEPLIDHVEVDMISFTGSTAVGKTIAAKAAERCVRTALELGGKSPSVILPGADVNRAVRSTINSCFLNSGQTCNALTRLLVPAGMLAEISEEAAAQAERFKPGDPFDPATRLGPLINESARERLWCFIEDAQLSGATLVAGGVGAPDGAAEGYFVKPTILAGVDPRATVAQEELFGPVLSIIGYEDEADAARIANDVRFGLAAAVWASDDDVGYRFAQRLRAGQIDVNGAPFNLFAPFGGFKESGSSRENGIHGIEEFTALQSIQLPAA